ncbi:MAG: hypothetical protein ACP5NP_12855 [Acetobacteraceae bacterium]
MTQQEIDAACYVGSAEHKARRWWGGLPGARVGPDGRPRRPKREHTTICDRVSEQDREQATTWVRAALKAGQVRFFEGDQIYPKHIWYRDESGQYWFGFGVNPLAGTYKGWPISEDEKRAAFD